MAAPSAKAEDFARRASQAVSRRISRISGTYAQFIVFWNQPKNEGFGGIKLQELIRSTIHAHGREQNKRRESTIGKAPVAYVGAPRH